MPHALEANDQDLRNAFVQEGWNTKSQLRRYALSIIPLGERADEASLEIQGDTRPGKCAQDFTKAEKQDDIHSKLKPGLEAP